MWIESLNYYISCYYTRSIKRRSRTITILAIPKELGVLLFQKPALREVWAAFHCIDSGRELRSKETLRFRAQRPCWGYSRNIIHLPESIVFRPSSVSKLPYDVSSLRQHGLCHNMAPGKYIYNVTITTPCEFNFDASSTYLSPYRIGLYYSIYQMLSNNQIFRHSHQQVQSLVVTRHRK